MPESFQTKTCQWSMNPCVQSPCKATVLANPRFHCAETRARCGWPREKYDAAGWGDWHDDHQHSSEGVSQQKTSKNNNVMALLSFFRLQVLQWFGHRIHNQDSSQELGEGFHTLFNWVLSELFIHQILKFSFSPAFATLSFALYLQNLQQMLVSHTFCHILWRITILGSRGHISFDLQQSLHAVTVSTFRCKVQCCETCRVWGWWWCLMIH